MYKALGLMSALHITLGAVSHSCNPSTWKVQTRGSEVHGHCWIHRTLDVSLGNVESSLKNKNKPVKKNHLLASVSALGSVSFRGSLDSSIIVVKAKLALRLRKDISEVATL